MERSEDEAIAREKMYSRIGKARRAAGARKRGEFPVPDCPIPRSELAILTLRDQGLIFQKIAEEYGCSLSGVKQLTQRTQRRISDLTNDDYHDTDLVLEYVKKQGWLDQYRQTLNKEGKPNEQTA